MQAVTEQSAGWRLVAPSQPGLDPSPWNRPGHPCLRSL